MPDAGPTTRTLDTILFRARLALIWESLWPRLVPVLGVIGLYAVVAWFGLFEPLPRLARLAILFAFLVALASAIWPFLHLSGPSLRTALARIDRDAGVPHRPATAATDRLANQPDDPVARALWAAHQDQAARTARRTRLARPSPGLAARDPYALRFALMLALVISFTFAGDQRLSRLLSVFDGPSDAVADPAIRIDAWVTPPAYTRKPPIVLTAGADKGTVAVPQGSLVIVRIAGDAKAEIASEGATTDAPVEDRAPSGTVVERRLILTGDATIEVRRNKSEAARFAFSVIPDTPPVISLAEPIKPSLRGSMTMSYRVEDDYGATAVDALFAMSEKGRPLYDPPKLSLPPPATRAKDNVTTATRDISQHPFAGADAMLTLVARDAAGNEGRSEASPVNLPGRLFSRPLARALVEQRRNLALDAGASKGVVEALDALLIAPDLFTKEAGIYLGLVSARHRLVDAKTDDDLRGVVDYLWQIALRIEEGDVSDAEKQLKAAQEKLREALERGASEAEIQKLTQELRQAMNEFLSQMARRQAEQQRNAENPLSKQANPNQQMISPEDLNAMLNRMEQLMKNGSKDEAQQLLSQLNDMLENLQSDTQAQGDDPATRELERSLSEMGDMIRKQQSLRDETFRQGNRGQQAPQGEQGQQGSQGKQDQQGEGGAGGLRERQEALRRQLEEMKRRLAESGAGQAGPGQSEAFGQAEQAMRDAEAGIGSGDSNSASDAQGRALDALRRGAQGMAQALQQGEGQGSQMGAKGQGRNGRAQRQGEGSGNGDDHDPLGRPTRSRSFTDGAVKVPGRGETAAERASRVLDELRRRYADPARPQNELDYIERLLRRN